MDEIKAKAFIDACFTEYKIIRDEVLVTTSEFYRILQFGSTVSLGFIGLGVTLWKVDSRLVKVLFGLIIPTLAYIYIQLLTGQVARIRKAAKYCHSLESKLNLLIGNPFELTSLSPSIRSVGWETWHEESSIGSSRHYPWIYTFGILLFFLISYCSLGAFIYFNVYQRSCPETFLKCIFEHKKISITIVSLIFIELLKTYLWLLQARQIARPLVGPIFLPREATWVYIIHMKFTKLFNRFRETSSMSGILIVSIQAVILWLGFGFNASIVLLTVAATGTVASIFRNRYSRKMRQSSSPEHARNWRNAIANAGIATILAAFAATTVGQSYQPLLAAIAISSLAAALSDTMSHEIGVMFGGTTRLIVNLQKAQPGDNGAVSLIGSLAGIITAFLLALWAAVLGVIQYSDVISIAIAACLGNLIDSFLGATIERWNFIGNNTVNFLCVLSAAVISFLLLR